MLLQTHIDDVRSGTMPELLTISMVDSMAYGAKDAYSNGGRFKLACQYMANHLVCNDLKKFKSEFQSTFRSAVMQTAKDNEELGAIVVELVSATSTTFYDSQNYVKAKAPVLSLSKLYEHLETSRTYGFDVSMVPNDREAAYDAVAKLYNWAIAQDLEGNPFKDAKGTRESTTLATVLTSCGLTIGEYLTALIVSNDNCLDWRILAEHTEKDSNLTKVERDRITRLLVGKQEQEQEQEAKPEKVTAKK